MFLKATIISWIIFIVLYLVLKFTAHSLSDKEKLAYKLDDELPIRCVVITLLVTLSLLESLVATVITIVKW